MKYSADEVAQYVGETDLNSSAWRSVMSAGGRKTSSLYPGN